MRGAIVPTDAIVMLNRISCQSEDDVSGGSQRYTRLCLEGDCSVQLASNQADA